MQLIPFKAGVSKTQLNLASRALSFGTQCYLGVSNQLSKLQSLAPALRAARDTQNLSSTHCMWCMGLDPVYTLHAGHRASLRCMLHAVPAPDWSCVLDPGLTQIGPTDQLNRSTAWGRGRGRLHLVHGAGASTYTACVASPTHVPAQHPSSSPWSQMSFLPLF